MRHCRTYDYSADVTQYNPFGQNKHLVAVTVTVDGHSIINTVPVHCNWPDAHLHRLDRFTTDELLEEIRLRFLAEDKDEDDE